MGVGGAVHTAATGFKNYLTEIGVSIVGASFQTNLTLNNKLTRGTSSTSSSTSSTSASSSSSSSTSSASSSSQKLDSDVDVGSHGLIEESVLLIQNILNIYNKYIKILANAFANNSLFRQAFDDVRKLNFFNFKRRSL